jgi:ADP-heptose:LPS heptosyltransferase
MPLRSVTQTLRDGLFFRMCGVRRVVGLNFARSGYSPLAASERMWESEAKRLLRSMGVDQPSPKLADFSLGLTAEEEKSAEDVLQRAGVHGPFIAICLGTKIPVNDWGDERWSTLLKLIRERISPMSLVTIGSSAESERSARLASAWSWRTANLCGRLTPRQSAAVLAAARLFIGHDSGPMHLAAAMGTTTVAIFSGREPPGVWFPFAQEQNVFFPRVPCDGCRVDECLGRRTPCILTIRPSDVARCVVDNLASTSSLHKRVAHATSAHSPQH